MKNNIKKRLNQPRVSSPNRGSTVVSIEMNNYVKPSTQCAYSVSNGYVYNGFLNNYFTFLEERYFGSTTNAACIDSISDYIYGLGLVTSDGQSVSNIIANDDLRDIILDYKMFGQCALEIIYNRFREVTNIYHMPMKSIAVKEQADYNDSPKVYYYCFDFNYQGKFQIEEIPAFGVYESLSQLEKNNIEEEGGFPPTKEVMVIGLMRRFPYFRMPDYQSCLQYAQVEEEVSNFSLKWIENSFSAGHVVNINKGLEDTEEGQAEAERDIRDQLTGSNNAGRFFLSFNDNPESATTIEAIDNSDEHEKYTNLSIEAQKKILLAHKFFPILLGQEGTTGFSNNADELNTALRTLYRNTINPMREVLLDGLEKALKTSLKFVDFEDLVIKETVEGEVPVEETITTDETIQE